MHPIALFTLRNERCGLVRVYAATPSADRAWRVSSTANRWTMSEFLRLPPRITAICGLIIAPGMLINSLTIELNGNLRGHIRAVFR
jgi:hypothetical protein